MFRIGFSLFLLSFIFINSVVAQDEFFIVRRDVPENPSFVVIPVSWHEDDIEYADTFEETLIKFGLKVVNRPSIRNVTETKGVVSNIGTETKGVVSNTGTETKGVVSNIGTEQTGSKTMREEYLSYEATGAHYVILTNVNSKRAKIVNIKTREILSTSKFYVGNFGFIEANYDDEKKRLGVKNDFELALYKILEGAGITLKISLK